MLVKILPIILSLLLSEFTFALEQLGNKGAKIFDQVKLGVFQIKTAMGPDSPKASYGSGFVIDKNEGLIATNYHVVASSLQDEKKQQKIYVLDGNKNLAAAVVHFSVIHDLAILKVNKKFSHELILSQEIMKKGERLFSLGVPKDLNLSMVEGTFNGLLSYGIYEEIHMSSAINSGMSGGPSINSNGEVIGINVSMMLNSQSISFCVPVKFLLELWKNKEIDSSIHEIVTTQLTRVQDSLAKEMVIPELRNLDGWIFPKLPETLKCWSDTQDSPKFTYSLQKYDCNLNASSYIQEGVYAGTYDIHYFSVKNKNRNSFQFYSLLNYIYNDPFFEAFLPDDANENLFTRQSCDQKIIVNSENISFKVNYCLIGYTNYPGLFNAIFKAVSLHNDSKAIILKWRLNGFSLENIKKMSGQLISKTKLSSQKSERKL